MNPILMVDVNGPLYPFAAKHQKCPDGYSTYWLRTPRWEAAERRRLTDRGLPNEPIKPLKIWLNPRHGPALAALPFELVWATTWQEEANDIIAPLLGLRALPFISWPEQQRYLEDGIFWKTPKIISWVKERPFAWIDDCITKADRAWIASHHEGPHLLHCVDPGIGLTESDFTLLFDWSNSLQG